MAIGAGTCIGTVLYAQSLPKDTAEGKEMRGQLMSVHKSIGLAMAVFVFFICCHSFPVQLLIL
jgi:cytochrome b561